MSTSICLYIYIYYYFIFNILLLFLFILFCFLLRTEFEIRELNRNTFERDAEQTCSELFEFQPPTLAPPNRGELCLGFELTTPHHTPRAQMRVPVCVHHFVCLFS